MSGKSLVDKYMELTGANKFLAEHCGKTLGEIDKLVKGVSHSVNRCNAEYADCWVSVKETWKLCEKLAKDRDEIYAAIGQIQEQIKTLEESLEKSRKAYAELRKDYSNEV
jgi:nitrate/TMAO reductase-like tetraheme cytochrome c subunit